MFRLLDPSGTLAIILGASDWSKAGLSNAPSFRRSAAELHRYLLSPGPRGLDLEPDLIVSLFDDPSPASAQLGRIRDAVRNLIRERASGARPIHDVLMYYVGHGAFDESGHLHLLVRDSSEGIEAQSSIATQDLAQVMRVAAPQQRRLVILDCCFSEAAVAAFGAMSGTLEDAVASTAIKDLSPIPVPERGTLLLCSSPRRQVSLGKPNAEHTLFTGALLNVLHEGADHITGEMLSFFDLREVIYDCMLREHESPPRPALHQPEQQAGDLTRLPAFPNAASLRRAEEDRRAEGARLAEEQRKAEEAWLAEEQRQAEEARLAEEQRKAEEAWLAEEQRQAEDARSVEEQHKAEEARLTEEPEQFRLKEERRWNEEREKAEERKRFEEEAREKVRRTQAAQQEQEREARPRREEARQSGGQDRLAEQTRISEDTRLAEQRREAVRAAEQVERHEAEESARLAQERRQAEDKRKVDEAAPLAEDKRKKNVRRGILAVFLLSAVSVIGIVVLTQRTPGPTGGQPSELPSSSPSTKILGTGGQTQSDTEVPSSPAKVLAQPEARPQQEGAFTPPPAMKPPVPAQIPASPQQPVVVPPPAPLPPSPLERAKEAASVLPCAALTVQAGTDPLKVAGLVQAGPEFDRWLLQLGLAAGSVMRVDGFACAPLTSLSHLVRRTWDSAPPALRIHIEPLTVASGARVKVSIATTLPLVYIDLYQPDGSVRHLAQGTNRSSVDWTATPPAGQRMIAAIGAAAPLKFGQRPETERASDYLNALHPLLATAAAADLAIVIARQATPIPEKCVNIINRVQLGESLSDADRAALRTECRS